MEKKLDKKYKKIPNNENTIEIDGKVVLSFDPRYKEYLKWRDENPDLEQQLIDDLEHEIRNKELYNNGAPHESGDIQEWYNEDGQLILSQKDGCGSTYYENGHFGITMDKKSVRLFVKMENLLMVKCGMMMVIRKRV